MRNRLTAFGKMVAITFTTFALLIALGSALKHTDVESISRLINLPAQAQGINPIAFPLAHFTPFTATATSQNMAWTAGSVSTTTIQVLGTSLTTVTWQITASNDAGTTYYAIPSSTGAYTSNVLTVVTGGTITTTSSALYYVNLSGFDHFKIATSGTFTATSVKFIVTGSSNKGIL